MKNMILLLVFWFGFQNINAQKQIAIYWDVSYSMKDRKIDRELQYLNNYFKKYQVANVTLVMFSNDIILKETYAIKAGNWTNLKQELQNTIYDGATSFSNLFKDNFEESFLFSDGIENLDKFRPPTDKPLHIISTLPCTNAVYLKLAADLSSGSYVYLNSELEQANKIEKIEQLFSGEPEGYVTGTISGIEGPLINVSVINKNSNQGIASSAVGTYKIKAIEGDILTFTYLGKKTVNIRVTKADVFNITMGDIEENLDEVVITSEVKKVELVNTGNNKVDKKRLGYSIESIGEEEISGLDTDVKLAVKGQFAGLEIQNNTAQDRVDLSQFLGRGKNMTITGNQYGLIVLDGVPLAQSNSGAGGGFVSDTSFINPDMIVDITYLKGLAATNKYGAKGMNGVLLITTKNAVGDKANRKKKNKLGTTATYSGNAQLISELPEVSYIKVLKTSKTIDQAFQNYLLQREQHGNKPEFYLDTYDYFRGWNSELLSKRVLSNVYEIAFSDVKALRALSYKQQANRNYKDAVVTLKRVQKLESKQSQSYRDLALANNYAGNYIESLKIYDNIDNNRSVGNIVLLGMNKTITNETKNLIALHRNQLNVQGINQKFLRPIKYKARVVFEWNNFDAEFDLNIINQQKRFFTWSHTIAENSQRILQEKELGYGLEEFYLTSSDLGEWTFNMKYYGNRSKLDQPTYVKITIYKNFGSANETKDIKVVRLHKKDIEQNVVKLNVN
ncbi:MAG: hypothetical protein DRI75_04330 [Bacteroidetes bacterium]|nr:MAG: hypothetical protein DRI75_04330 [Bacteroidota bacterium]